MNVDPLERFTEGDCHWLALAINQLDSSWRLATFDGDIHAFVVKGNHALDIEGRRTLRQLCKAWDVALESITEATVDELESWGEIFLESEKPARLHAKRLLKAYG